MNLRYTLSALALMIGLTAVGQNGRLDRAEKLFERYAYSSAIDAYQNVLQKDEANVQARLRLGDCYRMLNDYGQAADWYGSVADQGDLPSEYNLVFGMMLQAQGRCDEARSYFDAHASANPEDSRGAAFASACGEESGFRLDLGVFELKRPEAINSERTEFAPTFFGDILVFASSRNDGAIVQRRHAWNKEPFLDLYKATSEEGEFGKPEALGIFNSKFHEGPAAFHHRGNLAFITRNSSANGKRLKSSDGTVKTQIFMGPIDGSELNPMPFSNAEYSDGHPAISDNGKTLIFSSDRPGGLGGLDLWMSVLENGKWSEPQNLGADINTEGDEAFPFIDWYGKLYFASNGHPGLGGLDVLVAESVNDAWAGATNLGFPVNSSSDDFGLIWDRDHSRGVFASNREGGAGSDDLYTIERLRTILAGEAFDAETGERLKGVTIRYGDEEVESNEEGRFEFDLVRSQGGDISAEFDGYLPFVGDAEETGAGDRFIRLELQRGRKFEGVARNDDGAPLAGTMLTLMDDLGNVIAETEAMDDGSFSFEVLNPDADREFVVVAEKDGFADAKFEAAEAGAAEESSMEVVLAKATRAWSR